MELKISKGKQIPANLKLYEFLQYAYTPLQVCVAVNGCEGCFFEDKHKDEPCEHIKACIASKRSDKTSVIFYK